MTEILTNPEVPDKVVNVRQSLANIMQAINQSPELGKLLYTLLRIRYIDGTKYDI